MTTRILAAGLALPLTTSACASALPPPPDVASRPDPVLPDLASAPAKPPAGLGVVVFDSVSGPATVSRVVGHGRQSSTTVTGFGWISFRGRSTATETICPQTPCVGYLPYGDHEVILESTESNRSARYVVTSSDVPRALRASLDIHVSADTSRTLGAIAFVVGAAVGGVSALALAGFSADESSDTQTGFITATILGGTLAALGAVLFLTGHPGAYYDGQGTLWEIKQPAPPPASAAPTGTSL